MSQSAELISAARHRRKGEGRIPARRVEGTRLYALEGDLLEAKERVRFSWKREPLTIRHSPVRAFDLLTLSVSTRDQFSHRDTPVRRTVSPTHSSPPPMRVTLVLTGEMRRRCCQQQ